MLKMTDRKNDRSVGMYQKWTDGVSAVFSGKTKKQRLLYPALAAFFCGLAFLFYAKPLPYTTLAVGVPLADALLCSASTYTPFVYIGSILGSYYHGVMSIPSVLALSFTFVLRIITGSKTASAHPERSMFFENKATKVAVSVILCFLQCGMFLAQNGIDGKTAVNVLATLIATPLLTFIFSVYYEKRGDTRFSRFMHEFAMISIFSCAVYCAQGITFAFFTLDTLLCVFFTLCISKFGGFARGALYGFLLGYIASPTYFICFLLMGAVGSLVFSLGALGACGISAAVACISAILIGGANSLMSIVPETVLACAAVTPIIRYAFLPKTFPYPPSDAEYADSFSENMRCALAELSFIDLLKKSSDNLKEINTSVQGVLNTLNTGVGRDICITDQIRHDFCDFCPMVSICHENERENCHMAISQLIDVCSREGISVADNIPPYLSRHCIHLRELTEYVIKSVKKQPLIAPANQISPLLTYSSASDIISDIYASAKQELVFDAVAEKSVTKLFYSVGIPFGGVSVIGKSRKKVFVYGSDKTKVGKALNEIEKGLNRIFGCDYRLLLNEENQHLPIIFSPKESLNVESSVYLACKKGEVVSGDTAISFENGETFCALISDGMGSGPLAAKSSSLTATLIRGFLLSGIDEGLAVRLASEALPHLCDECFSTVDLLKIDLVSGVASVVKNHAAASYILRSGSVYCCDAHSMPIGITDSADQNRTSLQLKEGDTIVMVSDGVCEGPNDALKLPDIIGLNGDMNIKDLARQVVARAQSIKGERDDMSALVIRISKAS
jgi:stage II sporulation protein E